MLKDRRLEPIEQKAIRFQNLLAYDDDYNGTALDVAEGDRIAETLGNKSAVLMGAHGVLVTGSTVASAYDDLYYLERAAQVQVLAMSTGRPLRELSSEVIKRTAGQSEGERAGAQGHFEALKRVLDRDEADYKD